MNIIALDLSFTCTGWARRHNYGTDSGRTSFITPKNKEPGFRFHLFGKWLKAKDENHRTDAIVIERPHMQGWGASNAGIGLATRVEEYCAIRNIPYIQVQASSLKKFITGNGRASKEEVQSVIINKYPHYDPTGDKGMDESDALALLTWGLENITLEEK